MRPFTSQCPFDAPVQHDGLAGDTQTAAPDTAIAHETRGDIGCDIRTDRETDALCLPDNRGIDANDAAATVNERAARVARIERCISLNDAVHQPSGTRAQTPPERTHDAGCDAGLVAERITDRDDELT